MMGRTGWIAWVWLVGVLGLGSRDAYAGRLESVRSEVSGSSSSSSSSSDSSSSDSSCCYGSSSSSSSSTDVAVAPAPRLSFRRYPYAGGTGDFRYEARASDERARKRAGQVWTEGAWQGRGLWRSAAGLRIDGQYFGFDGDLSYYLEPAAKDALYLGTANLNIVPIHARRGIFRLGGGFNTMIDGRLPGEGHREYALGWNVTSSVDLFPAWPVVLSARADVGQLYHAFMGRARASVGVVLWRMEIYGGYEHTQIGKVGLGGPMLGIRLWL